MNKVIIIALILFLIFFLIAQERYIKHKRKTAPLNTEK
ncbi:hypothetical protein bhDAH_001098 (plasmid) [Borrelia hermsii DAH]|nr:hypothetical protein bhDAH_001098 [Borrelia hermsii DAH]